MAYYRLYQLHGPKNEVEGFEEFEAGDDIEAIDRAESFRRLNPMELWSEHRKVHRWDGDYANFPSRT
jgi:hypothetical protein